MKIFIRVIYRAVSVLPKLKMWDLNFQKKSFRTFCKLSNLLNYCQISLTNELAFYFRAPIMCNREQAASTTTTNGIEKFFSRIQRVIKRGHLVKTKLLHFIQISYLIICDKNLISNIKKSFFPVLDFLCILEKIRTYIYHKLVRFCRNVTMKWSSTTMTTFCSCSSFHFLSINKFNLQLHQC